MFNKKSKFTLIELIVVIAVLGILSAIVIPNISNMNEKAKVAAVKSNIRNIQTAVDMYKLDKDSFPTDKQPEFIEDKDNIKNTSGLLVEKEPINFEKDNFVTDYLRKKPKDGNVYYVDAWGIVSVEGLNGEPNVPENPTIEEKVKIIAGRNHSFAILDTGEVYSWGDNQYGQLGIGNKESQSIPTIVPELSNQNIIDIKLGASHAVALTEDGKVYSWGNNSEGQLGLGNSIAQLKPQLIETLNGKEIVDIECQWNGTMALTKDGQVYGWGYNGSYQLGMRTEELRVYTPILIPYFSDKNIIDIETGESTSSGQAISKDGELYGWGSNLGGLLGLGSVNDKELPQKNLNFKDKKVKSIEMTYSCSFTILEDGSIWAWGSNSNYELGVNHKNRVAKPIELEFYKEKNITNINVLSESVFLTSSDNTVYMSGLGTYGVLGVPESHVKEPKEYTLFNGKDIRRISGGSNHCFVSLNNGEIYAIGNNTMGQLGLGDNLERINPELVTFFK